MQSVRDEFLSEEDLDLRNLSDEELIAYWNLWLEQAQMTNELDQNTYSMVFSSEHRLHLSRGRNQSYTDHAAAVSFGSSMVPLNFGGSSSIPKFPEYSSSIFAISSDVRAGVSGALANSTTCSSL